MDEIIKMLDEKLEYIKHEIDKDTLRIHVASNREVVKCPFCYAPTTNVHSTYSKSFQDLPIQGKKVVVILENRKMFCLNADCSKKHLLKDLNF